MNQISHRKEASRLSRVAAASVAVLFFLASCSWAPNQNISSSEFNIRISSSDISPTERTEQTGSNLFESIAGNMTFRSGDSEATVSSLETREEPGLEFELEAESESALLLYYVERDVLATTGLEPVDAGALLDRYFERRYGTQLSEGLEFEYDPEEFESFILSFFAEYGINLEELEEGAELDLTEEEELELFFRFLLAIIEFLFQPFVALLEFIQAVFINGVLLESRLASGAGAYQLFIRGGSIAEAESTVNFTLRNLRPGVEYVVIVGYYESFYEQFDENDEPFTPLDLEAFGFDSFTLEEGLDSRLTIRVDTDAETAEGALNLFLNRPEFIDLSILALESPQYLVDFGNALGEELGDIVFPVGE